MDLSVPSYPRLVIYCKFHLNPFRGLGAIGGRNLAIPITSAISFYNSFYYGTHILHSDKCHQTLFANGLNTRTTNPRWPTADILKKVEKSPYRPITAKSDKMTQCDALSSIDGYNFAIWKIKEGGGPPFSKPLNRDISATVWPISMKFGKWSMLTFSTLLSAKILNFLKSKDN